MKKSVIFLLLCTAKIVLPASIGFAASQALIAQANALYVAQMNLSIPNPNIIVNSCSCPTPTQATPFPIPNLLITMHDSLGNTVNSYTFTVNPNFKSQIAIVTIQLFPPSNGVSSSAVQPLHNQNSYAISYSLQSPDGVYFQKELQYSITSPIMQIKNGFPTIPITIKIYQIGSSSNTLINTTQILPNVSGQALTAQQQIVNSFSPITQKYFLTINNTASNSATETPCFATTTANLTATYANGSSGVGATLTSTSNGAFSTDGVTPTVNARILVKNQTTKAQNGIYVLTSVGTSATPWVLTRAIDYDTSCEIQPETFVSITSGTLYANTSWQQTATVSTVGTDAVVFVLFSIPTFTLTPTVTAAVSTTANLSATYANGAAGVGATLTSTSNGVFSTDGIFPALNALILVKNQTTNAQNGVYRLTTVGTSATPWVLTRYTSYDTSTEILPATFVSVTSGRTFADTIWQQTANVATMGTDAITFALFITPTFTVTPLTACLATTTANLPATYANGTAGVGATLTSTSNGAFFTDGISPSLNARILVKSQTTAAQNGIYTLTTVGTSSTPWVLTRATDYDTIAEVLPTTFVPVTSGATYAQTLWQQTNTIATMGTTSIVFFLTKFITPTATLKSMSGTYDPNTNITTPSVITSVLPTTVTVVVPVPTTPVSTAPQQNTTTVIIAPITITLYNGQTPYLITFQPSQLEFTNVDLINGLQMELFIYPPLYHNGSTSNNFNIIATLQTLDGLKFQKLVFQTVPFTTYPILFTISTTSLQGNKTNWTSVLANSTINAQMYNLLSPIHFRSRLQQTSDQTISVSIV